MTEQRVSFRYARAILEAAVQEGVADKIFGDFFVIHKILNESKELRAITSSPVLQHHRKEKIYDELFKDRISPLAMSFIHFLLDKKRGELIRDVIAQYELQYNLMNNKLPVEIFTSIALPDELKAKIVKELADWTKKTILPEFKVQQDLKGGIMIKVDDWVYDATFKNQLESLYKTLAESGAI